VFEDYFSVLLYVHNEDIEMFGLHDELSSYVSKFEDDFSDLFCIDSGDMEIGNVWPLWTSFICALILLLRVALYLQCGHRNFWPS